MTLFTTSKVNVLQAATNPRYHSKNAHKVRIRRLLSRNYGGYNAWVQNYAVLELVRTASRVSMLPPQSIARNQQQHGRCILTWSDSSSAHADAGGPR